MNRVLIAAVAATTRCAGPAVAQSAKFAAIWDDEPEMIRSPEMTYCDNLNLTNTGEVVATRMAEIKVPQSKELLVGLSAQVELFTGNLVKGKRGSYSKAYAMAEGAVELHACNKETEVCYLGQPGKIVLSRREQELEAILAGVIEECDVTVDPEFGDTFDATTASGSFNLGNCTVSDEMINLALTTMAAHHFNFVFPDLPEGDYDVIARFTTDSQALAEAICPDVENKYLYCQEGEGSAGASAYAVIGQYMMTIQEVRAVKGSLAEPIIVD
jgi:hypothetical protein